uniref:LIM zinc-binding domain-containing protein n=1 Tax=Branchiostoma floridae TaxID=7739 RepID=C3YP56_BRAFL|eukprot:XP_002601935.1 hypothetical protein BRAFLDRAFT_86419 [Branchiostoma floridae]
MSDVCPSCTKVVYFAERKYSLGKSWHKLCLKCTKCKRQLNPGGHAEKTHLWSGHCQAGQNKPVLWLGVELAFSEGGGVTAMAEQRDTSFWMGRSELELTTSLSNCTSDWCSVCKGFSLLRTFQSLLSFNKAQCSLL